MQLKDIMSKNVITIAPSETVANAARLMRESNIGCLVVANAGSVQGIATDRDLALSCLPDARDPRECQVSAFMTSPVITASPDMDVLDAAHMMTERRVKRLPVVQDDQLLGLVSLSDIAQALDRPMHDLLLGMGAARRAA